MLIGIICRGNKEFCVSCVMLLVHSSQKNIRSFMTVIYVFFVWLVLWWHRKQLKPIFALFKCALVSATCSKLSPQSLASTLVGVGARECEVSLAYILFSICILKRTDYTRKLKSWHFCLLSLFVSIGQDTKPIPSLATSKHFVLKLPLSSQTPYPISPSFLYFQLW